jgi:hypothetical protein
MTPNRTGVGKSLPNRPVRFGEEVVGHCSQRVFCAFRKRLNQVNRVVRSQELGVAIHLGIRQSRVETLDYGKFPLFTVRSITQEDFAVVQFQQGRPNLPTVNGHFRDFNDSIHCPRLAGW